jgi:hypothetical protein
MKVLKFTDKTETLTILGIALMGLAIGLALNLLP